MFYPAIAALRDGITQLHAGSLERAWTLFDTALQRTDDPAVRSEALRRKADIQRRRAEWAEAVLLASEAVQIATTHALHDHAAAALNVKGSIYIQRAEFSRAIDTFLAALRFRPEALQEGLICQNLGTTYAQQGRYEEASDWYARSSSAFQRAGHPREQILSLINQGSVQLDQDAHGTAESIFREALHQVCALPQGDAELQALAELNIAETLARRGTDLEEAFDLLLRATGYFATAGNRPHHIACHRVFAVVTEKQGFPELSLGALERGLELALGAHCPREIAHFETELARLRTLASLFDSPDAEIST